MRPVLAGCFDMKELYLTRLDLAAVALANDALDVQHENERRAQERGRG